MVWILLLILAAAGWLMMTRRLSATLTLPLAALAIALVAMAPQFLDSGLLSGLSSLVKDVLEPGVTRLSMWVFAVILGAVLAAQLQISGAAERVVRYAAEYAGENHFRIGLLLMVVIAILFTSLGGLGAVILVATITLPLMFSLGFDPRVAGGLFLLSLSLGGSLNPVNWQFFISELGLEQSRIAAFAVLCFALFFLVCCLFLWNYTVGLKRWRQEIWPLTAMLLFAGLIGFIALRMPALWSALKHGLAAVLLALLALLLLGCLLRLLLLGLGRKVLPGTDNWLSAASVLVPLLLILWSSLHANIVGAEAALIQIPIISALLIGIIFNSLASQTGDGAGANRLMRALFEGVTQAGPAVVLLIGIGLLLMATALPAVKESFAPLWSMLPASSPALFVLTFFLLSPLALYRGPLNLYGMGSGLVGIIFGGAYLPATLIMVAFFSVGMLQGVCDPTNTHNVWIANYCKQPAAELTRLTAPWVLAIVLFCLIAGSLMFGSDFSVVR